MGNINHFPSDKKLGVNPKNKTPTTVILSFPSISIQHPTHPLSPFLKHLLTLTLNAFIGNSISKILYLCIVLMQF